MKSRNTIEDLKRESRLVQMVRDRITLEQRGKEYTGICPFHAERTPSFTVYEKDGVYLFKCHGCGANGNLVQFVERRDGISFSDAIKKCESYLNWKEGAQNVEQTFAPTLKEEKEAITIPVDRIAEAESALSHSEIGLRWLKTRGISLETAKVHRLGFVQSAKAVNPHHPWVDQGWIIFPTIENGQIVSLKYRSTKGKKAEDGTPGFLRKSGMRTCLYNLQAVEPFEDCYLVEGECLTGNTEVLTPCGWVRLDEYKGQEVAQWAANGFAEYVKPIAYVVNDYEGDLVHFTTKTRSINLSTTPEHRVVYKNKKGSIQTRRAELVPEKGAAFIRSVRMEHEGIERTENQIRLQIAIQADSSLEGVATYPGRWDRWNAEFSKQRKIQRLEDILLKLRYPYKKYTGKQTTKFRFSTPPGLFTKNFPDFFYRMSLIQKKLFISEVGLWDGHINKKGDIQYTSVVEKNVDLVQTVFVTSGLSAKKGFERGVGKRSDKYWVKCCKRAARGSHEITARTVDKEFIPFTGKVYCVQVPSSYIIVRKEGTVAVTGNCDALVMVQAGFVAVSLPSAGYNLQPDERDRLMASNRLFLAGDMDNPGQQAMTKLWTELKERTFKLNWPDGMKDANQTFLEKCGGNVEVFQKEVERLKQKALEQPMPFIHNLRESLYSSDDTKPMDNPARLRLPWANIDAWTAILPGDVVAVTATETGTGKTSWIMDILLENAVKYGKTVVNYSAEVLPAQYSRRAAAYLVQKSKDELTKEDFSKAGDLMRDARFYNGYKPGANYKDVIELLTWAKRRLGADIMVVDHLHFLTRGEKDETKAQSEAMRMLKDLALDYNLIMIVVGQPRKPLANHRGREAVTQDMKGSESFGSDASQVFILHRDRRSNGDDENMPIFDPVTKVKLDKSRESEPRATKLFFDGARCTFSMLENKNYGGYDE
jgi:hypothetical protein